MSKGFIFNTNRCVGCHACIVACANQNGVDPGISWRSVYQYNPAGFPAIPVFFHSLACQHCEEALCMNNCPANAFYRDPETDAVLVDRDKCIGCKYCTWACPFDAPEYNPFTKIVEKCTLCVEAVKTGNTPACAKCCPTGALEFTNLNPSVPLDPIKGFSDHGIGPRIQFVSARKRERIPEMAKDKMKQEASVHPGHALPKVKRSVSLGSEWSLVLFTFFVPMIIGIFAGAATSDRPALHHLFLGAGFIALLISLFHLGKKLRFYRAILNLKRSWLSREILSFLLFLGASSFTIIAGLTEFWLVVLVIVLGFLTTLSVDRVYHLQTRVDKREWHSSQTMLTAMLFISLFLESFFPFIFVLALKLMLYIYRKVEYYRKGKDPRWLISLLRILSGVSSPLFFIFMTPNTGWLFGLLSASLGELIDRIEFYLELDFISPEKDFSAWLKKDLQHTG